MQNCEKELIATSICGIAIFVSVKTEFVMRRFLLTLAILAALPCGAQQIQSQWAGRRVAFLGDSIIDVHQFGKLNNVFWNDLKDILGIEPHVYGISGHRMDHIPGQADKMVAELGQNFDAIIIFIGTNDYNNGVPIGEWFEYDMQEAIYNGVPITTPHRTPCFDNSTFRGRTNIALSDLKSRFPDKQIILLTPIHRAFFQAGPTNIQPDESHANKIGVFLDEYVRSIKEAGELWSVPVIDLNAICGLYPLMDEYAPYFRNVEHDRLHPNTPGHLRMAWSLAYQLLAYPSYFPKYVALTFDDGPNTIVTPQVLDLLREYDIPATFFVEGKNIDKKSAAVMRRAAEMGCEIENHSFNHPHLTELAPDKVADEIARTSALIEKYTGRAPQYLRPPYLACDSTTFAAVPDLTFIGGYCPRDWDKNQTVEGRISGTLEHITDGDVLLMHDFSTNQDTVEALKTIIPELKARGFTFVTVSDLMALTWPEGTKPRHNQLYHGAY